MRRKNNVRFFFWPITLDWLKFPTSEQARVLARSFAFSQVVEHPLSASTSIPQTLLQETVSNVCMFFQNLVGSDSTMHDRYRRTP